MIQPFINEPAQDQRVQVTLMQQLGLAHQQLGQFTQAKAAYDQAYETIQANPSVVSGYQQMMILNNLAYMLVSDMQGYEAQAVEIARRAAELMPADNMTPLQVSQILDTLGLALMRNNEIDEAVEVLRRSVEREAFIDNLLHLGQAYLAKGDNNQAQLTLLRAARMAREQGDEEALEKVQRWLAQAQ